LGAAGAENHKRLPGKIFRTRDFREYRRGFENRITAKNVDGDKVIGSGIFQRAGDAGSPVNTPVTTSPLSASLNGSAY